MYITKRHKYQETSKNSRVYRAEIIDLYRKIEESGTTPLMLVADAWKSLSIDSKESLLKVLQSVNDHCVPKLLEAIVRKWGEMCLIRA